MDVELIIDDVQVTAPDGDERPRRRAPRRPRHPGALPPRGRAGHRVLPPVPHGGAPAGPRLGAADDLVRLPGVGRPRRRDGLAAHPQAPRHEPAAAAAARPGRAGPQAARRAARRDGAAVRSRHRRAAARLHPVRALRARVLHPGLQRAGGHRPRRPQARRSALRADGRRGLRGVRLLRRGLPDRVHPHGGHGHRRARCGAAPSSSWRASAAAGRSRPKRTARRWTPRSP